MTILSGQTIRKLCTAPLYSHAPALSPFSERTEHVESGTTGGLSGAGYDVSVRESVKLPPGAFRLASTVEKFRVPDYVVIGIYDKSSLARRALTVKNTRAEPGWRGYLTLELSNDWPPWGVPFEEFARLVLNDMGYGEKVRLLERLREEKRAYDAEHTIEIAAGQPIAQIMLETTDEPVERPYEGRYQDQPSRPVPSLPLPPTTTPISVIPEWDGVLEIR